jgi:hypothetical protein
MLCLQHGSWGDEQTDTPRLQDPQLASLSSNCGAICSSPLAREALKRRGALTIWFDPAMTWEAAPTGKRGISPPTAVRRVRKRSGGPFPRRTLEIRAAEFITSDVGDAPMLSELLDPNPPEQEIASGELSRTPTAPSTPAGVTASGAYAAPLGHGPPSHHRRPRCRRDHPAPQERQALKARHRWSDGAQ